MSRIRLASFERRRFKLEFVVGIARRYNAESDVRRVLPVMSDGRVRVVHSRKPVHKCRRSERGFARKSGVKINRLFIVEFVRERNGEFRKKIVRMLAVVKRLAAKGFARLIQKRITVTAFDDRIEARHQAKSELILCAV